LSCRSTFYQYHRFPFLSGVLCIAQTTSKTTKDRGHLTIHKLCKEVDPKTVGQFIGLKDKRGRWGKEIYEGDVINFKCLGNFTAEVVFEKGKFTLKGWAQNTLVGINGKVIGNIYENKDLL